MFEGVTTQGYLYSKFNSVQEVTKHIEIEAKSSTWNLELSGAIQGVNLINKGIICCYSANLN